MDVPKLEKSSKAITKTESLIVKRRKLQADMEAYFARPVGSMLTSLGLSVVQNFLEPPINEQMEVGVSVQCQICNFVTDSRLVAAHSCETPNLVKAETLSASSSNQSTNFVKLAHRMKPNLLDTVENPVKKYSCPNCPFEGRQPGQLRRHAIECAIKFRLEENLAPCLSSVLPADINRRYKLKELSYPPLDITNQQPFYEIDCELCDEPSATLDLLYNHIRDTHKEIISKEKLFKGSPGNSCKQCDRSFYTKGGLERHYLGSHGVVTQKLEKAYRNDKDGGRCPICKESFICGLVDHFVENHNNNLQVLNITYRCSGCNERFKLMKEFNRHARTVHGSE